MKKNPQQTALALQSVCKDLERVIASLRPPYVNLYEQLEAALRPIRLHHQDLSRIASASEIMSARIGEVVKANDHLQKLADQATASTRMFHDLAGIHDSWLKSVKPLQEQIAQLQAVTKLSIASMVWRLTISERLFAGIDFGAIRRNITAHEPTIARLRESVSELTAANCRLVESIGTFADITRLPDFTLTGATREVFVTSHAVDVIQISDESGEQDASVNQLLTEVESETAICIRLLEALDPELTTPYIGARKALDGTNPDRVRHFLSSLRELWNHLLRHIAPDERVLAWIPRDRHDLLHKGRPTRKARVLYVCRKFNHAPLADFVDQDARALMALVEFFHRVHELNPNLTDEQVRALLLRTDSWLMYILQIWEASK
ncbi:MAG: hypothetical protein KatS3mg105_2207 [Gemmatales bacterium]|nr:MAG: hypothetical protein KatS3mg105_2207 [Gemmatales bacterium]